jgi:Phage integrase family
MTGATVRGCFCSYEEATIILAGGTVEGQLLANDASTASTLTGTLADGTPVELRRAITKEGMTTPKSGKSRKIPATDALVDELFAVLAGRRREVLARGWGEVPVWVFPSEVGTALDPRNVERVWYRVRRYAQALGVRPLKVHCTRHTFATFALRAGKSIRWVASVLGHADPAFTLRTYAHVMREEETDLSFAEFRDPGRPQTAPDLEERTRELANYAKSVARREGLEPPTPRFEAWCSIQLSYRRAAPI